MIIYVYIMFCTDDDECELGTHNCSSRCENTEGSFICSCESGYELVDQVNCRGKLISTYSNVMSILMVCCFLDINECEEGQHGCSHICENTLGSYSCLCFSGFRLSEDHLFCEGS